MLCFVLFLQIIKCLSFKKDKIDLKLILLKDNVRPSTRNSLGNSNQSFAPVNLKVDWPIVDFTYLQVILRVVFVFGS